jgi:hypothetical protein
VPEVERGVGDGQDAQNLDVCAKIEPAGVEEVVEKGATRDKSGGTRPAPVPLKRTRKPIAEAVNAAQRLVVTTGVRRDAEECDASSRV